MICRNYARSTRHALIARAARALAVPHEYQATPYTFHRVGTCDNSHTKDQTVCSATVTLDMGRWNTNSNSNFPDVKIWVGTSRGKVRFQFQPGFTDYEGYPVIDQTPPGKLGFTPARGMMHRVVITLRASNVHTFSVTNGGNAAQTWTRNFTRGSEGTSMGENAVDLWRCGEQIQVRGPNEENKVMTVGYMTTETSDGERKAQLRSVQTNYGAPPRALPPMHARA